MGRHDRVAAVRTTAAALAALVAATVLAGCGSTVASGGTPPPIPSAPTQPTSGATASFPSYAPTQVLPTPTDYPDLRVTGVDGCSLLTPAALELLGLAVAEGIDGADGSCDFTDDTGTVDVFLFLHPDRTLQAWGAEQADYTAWATLDLDGVTGVMATGGPQCSGVVAVAADATLEALVNAVDGDRPCDRATDVLTAALEGLRLAQ